MAVSPESAVRARFAEVRHENNYFSVAKEFVICNGGICMLFLQMAELAWLASGALFLLGGTRTSFYISFVAKLVFITATKKRLLKACKVGL